MLSSSLNFSTLLILPLPLRREELTGEERRRPDTLQLWQERERRQQQQQSGMWGAPRKDRCAQATARWWALEMSGNEPLSHSGLAAPCLTLLTPYFLQFLVF